MSAQNHEPDFPPTVASLNSVMPFFIVKNLQDSVKYYRDKLGFTAELLIPEHEPFFAIFPTYTKIPRDEKQFKKQRSPRRGGTGGAATHSR